MKTKEEFVVNSESRSSQKYYNDKWFGESDQGISLVGIKCKSCGISFFPPRNVCIRCLSEEIERFELNRKGKLFTYTKVYIPSKNFKRPYAIGYIDLPEGIRIFSQIKDWEKHDLKIGMEMELVIDTLWEDNEETKIIGYKFRPMNEETKLDRLE